MSDYSIVSADEAEDAYADSDVPGEFRALTEALEAEQVAVTLIRVPPHSDSTKVEDFWEASPQAKQTAE